MLCMAAGLWLWISSFIPQFKVGSDASGDAAVTGVNSVAILAVAAPRGWEEWSKKPLGLWLFGLQHQAVSRDNARSQDWECWRCRHGPWRPKVPLAPSDRNLIEIGKYGRCGSSNGN